MEIKKKIDLSETIYRVYKSLPYKCDLSIMIDCIHFVGKGVCSKKSTLITIGIASREHYFLFNIFRKIYSEETLVILQEKESIFQLNFPLNFSELFEVNSVSIEENKLGTSVEWVFIEFSNGKYSAVFVPATYMEQKND